VKYVERESGVTNPVGAPLAATAEVSGIQATPLQFEARASGRSPSAHKVSSNGRSEIARSLGGFQKASLFLAGSVALALSSPLQSSSNDLNHVDASIFDSKVRPFLDEYCVKCHGDEKQKGDRRFDTLAYPIADDDSLIDFQDVLDLLNLGEMPPEEEEQPSNAERQEVVNWLTGAVEHAYEAREEVAGETVLRRLSHREYFNTVRDLFQIDMSMFDPTETFPSERMYEHLDNEGETLVTSGYLLDQYIDAADKIVDKAIGLVEKPEPQTWRLTAPFLQQSELDKRHMIAHGQSHINIYEDPNSSLNFGSYGPLIQFEEGVPYNGYYEIKVLAEARNRKHRYEPSVVPNDPNEPMIMRIVPGHRRFGRLHLPQPYEPDLGTFELSDDGPQWYTVRSWLDEGFSPRFNYMNGAFNIRPVYAKTAKIVHKEIDHQIPEEDRKLEDKAFSIKYAKIPHIRIYEVQITGPLFDDWPSPSWRAVMGGEKFDPRKVRKILKQFADRAYRRPARKPEIDRLMAVVSSRVSKGRSPLDGLRAGLKAILISPAFLYLDEPVAPGGEGRLTDYALASRLSYFLWGTMPDQTLFDLARKKQLHKKSVLNEQILRMLADDRSDHFVSGFLDSWLTLRNIGEAPPDPKRFEVYYTEDLEKAMREETERFTRNALDQNEKLVRFLDADYSFVNEPLAELYGIDGVEGPEFRKVALNDPRRGGVLGQASILKITANGFDTSPVVRGVWLLENLLGTPPSPPPPDVEPLDPDIRGAKTIREQLTKHRDVATCYECHRKIDPLGFALENFDAIGQWRDEYEEGGVIDASGSLPNGSHFQDITGFRQALIEREGEFAMAVTRKMLAYALGRKIEFSDRPQINAILEALESEGTGFRDLVRHVALSDAFARP